MILGTDNTELTDELEILGAEVKDMMKCLKAEITKFGVHVQNLERQAQDNSQLITRLEHRVSQLI